MKHFVVAALLLVAVPTFAADTLTIVKAGPVGETATLAEANEVRVVFSQPMVTVGKVPKDLIVPWFHIAPAVNGTFRWSGTTTLIFTPDPKLPFATRYDVTIDANATSLAGAKLGKPYKFSFTTPTIKLVQGDSYRKSDGAIVIGLVFNQPIDRQAMLSRVRLRTKSHTFTAPDLPAAGRERLQRIEPQAIAAFDAKNAKAMKAATSDGAPILALVPAEWDRRKFPDERRLLVLETRPGLAPETQIEVVIDAPAATGASATSSRPPQTYTVNADRTFFVNNISCTSGCDPEQRLSIEFRDEVAPDELGAKLTVTDITDPKNERLLKPAARRTDYEVNSSWHSLDELGYSLEPAHTYAIRIDPSLQSTGGQTLGYTWMAVVENWHRTAFTSFGDENGVWESDGGTVLPFYSRNFKSVKQWIAPLTAETLVPTLVKLDKSGFADVPPVSPRTRNLSPAADKIQSFGVDIRPQLNASGYGLMWAALEAGELLSRTAAAADTRQRHSTLVQVTNLGITVKDSPQNTLVLITRLDNGDPVAGAEVEIRTLDNKVFWKGTTGADGIAIAPQTDIRRTKETKKPNEEDEWEARWKAMGLRFVVLAKKGDDVAYAASNWHDGILPWEFGNEFDLNEAQGLLRGTLFTDRGVYKLGEEVHVKAVIRSDTPTGMQLLPGGTKLDVVVRDSRDRELEKRTLTLSEWSSADWTLRIPADAPLGTYRIFGTVQGQRLQTIGEFLVAAYRRPDFRVDVTLTSSSPLTGTPLKGNITGRYLFGAPMAGLPVTWTYSAMPRFDVPSTVTDRWPFERWAFLAPRYPIERQAISKQDAKLDKNGQLTLELETKIDRGEPAEYRLEGEVTDVSRQKIAGRATLRVESAPWFIGLRRPDDFLEAAKGIDTQVVAVGLDGLAAPGVSVEVTLSRTQWKSVRRAEGKGFYEWETREVTERVSSQQVTTQAQPVPLHLALGEGGLYDLTAVAKDESGRSTTTTLRFYAAGAGYTAWERFDHNRIELVTDRTTYKPGDTAKVMIKSPWEEATALVTTEREGVRTWRQFHLTSTQPSVSIPITEADIPNIYVSVMLIKGRTKDAVEGEDGDPGKPSFRLGYLKLKVEDAAKRLKVDVKANRDEYRPATKARIDVTVTDAKGAGARSEVTLWAVDYGVLSLTAHRTPDVLESVYLEKALQVLTEDSRQKIINRRVITPKGAAEGGGGGRDAGPGVMRKDFRVLAFWIGSVVTDARGRARTEVMLPESLSTYRIMAVAADKASRFGRGETELRINKPVMMTPAFPRFLSVGDKAYFGAVVHSQLKRGGNAKVTIRSLDPNILRIEEPATVTTAVGPSASTEVRFNATAVAIGDARLQMSVSMNRETDAFEDVVPVRVLVTPETTAAHGSVGSGTAATAGAESAKEALQIPSDVVTTFGGLQIDLSSTAMTGLGEGARFLVEYPYGCAEQRSSAAFALMVATDLGGAFQLPGIDTAKTRPAAQVAIRELEKFQCGDGGYAFWPGECEHKWPYLTAWITHVLQRAQKLGYDVDKDSMERAYGYLEQSLNQPPPDNEAYRPGHNAERAFSIKVLSEGGRRVDSAITRAMSGVDRMPLYGIAHLADAFIARNDRGERYADLQRRLHNAILAEGRTAHVEEMRDDLLRWYWSSTVRTTAIVLGTLVRSGEDQEIVTRMVRWLMDARKGGRWGNTQENAWAMESLVDYYRTYEKVEPDFAASVTVGSNTVAQQQFRGRSTEAKSEKLPMSDVLRLAPANTELPVTFTRTGVGSLFYSMRLRYARSTFLTDALNQGFALQRSYAVYGQTKAATSFKAGDLIEVTLRIRNPKERKFVAITDPIPAGTEPVEAWFATTAASLVEETREREQRGWFDWWRRGGFDHIERHDDRVNLFATRLGEGEHVYRYQLRATTAGTFVTAPLHAEEMYQPEVFGRTGSVMFEVTR